MDKSLFQKVLPHLIAVLVFTVLSIAYFSPQLQGKVIQQGDIVSHRANTNEVLQFEKELGHRSLWTNALFGGMPTYQINTISDGNLVNKLKRVGMLFFKRPIGLFILLMVSFYLSMVAFGVNSWIAMIGAIAFGLTSNSLILYEAGHVTKIYSIAFLAPIVVGILLAFREKYLLGTLIFALGLSLNIASNHVQMTYYFFLCLLILGAIQLGFSIKNGTLSSFLKAAGYLIVGAIIALGTTASNLLPTQEYSRDTMRGKPILEKNSAASAGSSSTVEGLDWEYAMRWSNGWIDLVPSLIPGAAGGGSGEKVKKSSPLYKDANWRRVLQQSGGRAPLYWGNLPFTSGPIYFGAICLFLFILGLWLVKGSMKWWFALSVLFTFLLSMGHNMSWLNQTLFDYFPLFNKFRTPNSVMTITSFLIPFFGVFVLSGIAQDKYKKEDILKGVYISGGILGVICLFFALMGGAFFDFTAAGDQRYIDAGLKASTLIDARKHLMSSDAWRSLGLIAVAAGLVWAYAQQKINSTILIAVIALLTVVDFWTVGNRYLSKDKFVSARKYDNNFQQRPADKQILAAEKSRGDYRVFDLTGDPFNNARQSYYHNTIGGYHPAKLQRYQDLIDRHISQNNQSVLNMLNTKYVIGQKGQVQQNPAALGPAWFVNRVTPVNSANAEIDALKDFDPAAEAIIHQEFGDYTNGLGVENTGTIKLTNYRPDHLTYTTDANSAQLAVFSEIWYGPDKGWNAYIDGKAVDHIRANYVLRALKVPAGQHKVEFKFEPSTYRMGRLMALVSSLILLGGLVFVGWKSWKEEVS